MVALSVLGYWRIGRDVTARKPSTRISRLTVAASTGRLMKRSVNFMSEPAANSGNRIFHRYSGARSAEPGIHLALAVNHGFRIAVRATSGMAKRKSLFRRLRVRTERGLHLVVDVHGRIVPELQLATGDDHVALLDAGQHRHLVAARRPDRHHHLLYVMVRCILVLCCIRVSLGR